MNGMVSMNDYNNFGDGAGIGSASDLNALNKALDTGAYGYAQGVAGQTNGAALQVESLENSLKVLTYNDSHVKFWKKIYKSPAYNTVEEYNQLLSYGSENGGFTSEGALPDYDDSVYRRQASFVKFLGTTRSVTHPMTLVRSAHGDVISLENQNGIMKLMKDVEKALFWGNSKLAANGSEGVQFDGLNSLIDAENTIDLAGADLSDQHVNYASQCIIENYGTPTDLFLPFETLAKFSEQYFPKERVVMPTSGQGYQAGLVVNKFQTHGGAVSFEPDLFLQKTAKVPTKATSTKAPTPPATVTVTAEAIEGKTGEFGKSGAGTYKYWVTACNRHGESVATKCTTDLVLASSDLSKTAKVTITNASSMSENVPEFFRVYRTEKDGTIGYCVLEIPADNAAHNATSANAVIYAYDVNDTMPNTYTTFMGEFTPEVLQFKQLAPMMKMNLATMGPSYRWMILMYGVPQLYAPKKWVKIKNIKAGDSFGYMGSTGL